ncbi:hypothetical protein RB628_07980 [Streptomyces sp. ADMS]|uniref:hypothetical protein n=1 Tax=Streptomyces sp. ADMS TaxID=3071415 RepID=UPI0029700024|nr:hypothetical protein [Streptomyces sp. ADMS]MDW4905287.1 hypothetical protein [Streptomyces sp. ADMS]
MNLPQPVATAIVPDRTLVVEGDEDVRRAQVFPELALPGFPVRRPPDGLRRLDPIRPYRDLPAAPGRLVIDGGVIGELVYGPLRHGRSRVTWIQAIDFAESVAEREGAMLHPTGDEHAGEHSDDGSETAAAALARARVFRTTAQHVPVVSVHATATRSDVVTERARRIRALSPRQSQLRQSTRQLTIG